MRKIFLITLLLLVLSATNFVDKKFFFGEENFADAFPDSQVEDEETVSENFAEEVLELVNVEREKAGLKPLQLSPELAEAAAIRAEEITKKFSHTRPNGKSCFTVIKISCRAKGENIAGGQLTPEAVVKAWMDSKGHRENILNSDYGKLGVGYFYDADSEYKHYWVQLFKD